MKLAARNFGLMPPNSLLGSNVKHDMDSRLAIYAPTPDRLGSAGADQSRSQAVRAREHEPLAGRVRVGLSERAERS